MGFWQVFQTGLDWAITSLRSCSILGTNLYHIFLAALLITIIFNALGRWKGEP